MCNTFTYTKFHIFQYTHTMKHRRSFTTDDILHDIENGVSDDKIQLINFLNKQHVLIEECNKIICQETTKFILKNKPIFDAEKLKLYKLETIKTQLINIGMRKIYSIEYIVIDDKYRLDENTFSKCWNDNAKKINALVNKCVDINNRNYTANSIITMKDKAVKLVKKKKYVYVTCLFLVVAIFAGLYLYYNDMHF